MAEFFCAKPFEHFEVQHNGGAYLCCPGWLPESVGSVNQPPPEGLWNGEAARRIRASILDGSFRYCTGCPFLGSKRDPVQHVDDVTDPEHLAILRHGRVVVDRIRTVYLAYDRTCNLSCPSCRKDVVVAKGDELKRLTVFQNAIVTPELLASIDMLNITGSGDPFASSLFRGLLRSLNAAHYPHLRISLHTNGLLFSPENWDAMKAAQPMIKSVEVSVDAATEPTYVENRRGGVWDLLLERLEFIKSLRVSGPIEYFKMSFVVQANNWREMAAFVGLARNFDADTVLFTALRNWGTFSEYEYRRRAVHMAGHPENYEFLSMLGEEQNLYDERVVMTDFASLREAPQARRPW